MNSLVSQTERLVEVISRCEKVPTYVRISNPCSTVEVHYGQAKTEEVLNYVDRPIALCGKFDDNIGEEVIETQANLEDLAALAIEDPYEYERLMSGNDE